MTLGDLIRQYRIDHNCSMETFAKRCGLSKAYISILERNYNPSTKREAIPSLSAIKSVSAAMGMDFNDVIAILDGNQKVQLSDSTAPNIPAGFTPMPEMLEVPLIGQIACGQPIMAEQNIERMVSIPTEWRADFTLLCEGDSMAPRIQDGDLVAIRIQQEVENGEIAAVRIGDEATLKHVYLYPEYIELRPENPEYQSIIKFREEMNEVIIEGKAVGLCRPI